MNMLLVVGVVAVVIFGVLLGVGIARVARADADPAEGEYFTTAVLRGILNRREQRDRRRTEQRVEAERRSGTDRRAKPPDDADT